MAYVLKEGDKVTVETTEFTGGKEKKRIYTRVKAAIEKVSSMGYAPPSHYAQLVRIRQSSKYRSKLILFFCSLSKGLYWISA